MTPQATGHGAGAPVGEEALLLDTSGLDAVVLDPGARSARTGSGARWGQVNAAAWSHGLLGLAGSAPGVAVSGYTFGGGFGWLTRPHGTAASALRRVQYVTGLGELRVAADDAADAVDREAMWAFRGGGGVGLATSLEFDLFPAEDLWAGYLLWEASASDAVTRAWADGIRDVGADVATSLSVLHLPPAPAFPQQLRGRPAVHLALASVRGPEGAHDLLSALRRAAPAVVDTWGPSDAARLATIHLDPPGAVPALGQGRWLDHDAPAVVAAALRTATAPDTPLVLVEIRNVDHRPSTVPGAATTAGGPYVLHAVAPLRPGSRGAVDAAFTQLLETVAEADTGRVAAPWMDGASSTPGALAPADRARVRAAADAADPDGVLFRSRYLTGP